MKTVIRTVSLMLILTTFLTTITFSMNTTVKKIDNENVTVLLPGDCAEFFGDVAVETAGNIGYFKEGNSVDWNVDVKKAGKYELVFEAACPENQGGEGIISIGDKSYKIHTVNTPSWIDYKFYSYGQYEFPVGQYKIDLKAEKLKNKYFMNLRSVKVIPEELIGSVKIDEPTGAKVEPEYIDLTKPSKSIPIIDTYKPVEAENFCLSNNVEAKYDNNTGYANYSEKGGYASYNGMSFVLGRTKLELTYANNSSTKISLNLDKPDGISIGNATLDSTNGEFKKVVIELNNANQTHDLYLTSNGAIKIDSFVCVVTKSDYKASLDYCVDYFIKRNSYGTDWGPSTWGMYAKMYHETGDERYKKAATEIAHQTVAGYKKDKKNVLANGFLYRLPIFEWGEFVLNECDITIDEKEILTTLLKDLLVNGVYDGGNVMNRHMGYTLGIPLGLKLFPDIPQAKEIQAYADSTIQEFKQLKEPLEDSAGYEAIDYMYIADMIEVFKLDDLYNDPDFKKGIYDLVEKLNNVGTISSYGDYGGDQSASVLFIAALEKFASVYKDGKIKELAHRFMQNSSCNDLNKKTPVDGWSIQGLYKAYLWADESIKTQPLSSGSVVTERLSGYLDKAIFKSDADKPNNLSMMMDLLNGGEHSDNDSLAVSSISNGRLSYLYEPSNRDDSNHSKPVVRDSISEFPRAERYKEGWQFVRLELPRNWSWENFSSLADGAIRYTGGGYSGTPILNSQFVYNPLKQFVFALSGTSNLSGKAKFYIDNLTLYKKDGTEKVIENFENQTNWIGNNFKIANDSYDGSKCGEFDFVSNTGKIFDMPLDVNSQEYRQLTFWIKFGGVNPDFVQKDVLFTIGDKQGYPRNYFLHHSPMYPTTLEYFLDGANSTFASFSIDEKDYRGQSDVRNRKVLFSKDNLIWVRDVFDLKENTNRAVGTTWRFDNLSQNENWFVTNSNGTMFLYMLPRENTKIANTVDLVSAVTTVKMGSKVAYQASDKGEKYFDSILIPMINGQDAKALADSIKVEYDSKGVTLLSVGEDKMLMNEGGKLVTVGNITTDCISLYVKYFNGKLEYVSGASGTQIKIDNNMIVSNSKKQDVLEKNYSITKPVDIAFDGNIATINGQKIVLDTDVNINGEVYVPFRFIGEMLKFNVVWNERTSTASLKSNSLFIDVKEDTDVIYVNGNEIKLSSKITSSNGRILLPLELAKKILLNSINIRK